jgi:hypothetical protein
MWPYAADTIRQALRGPGPWVLAAVGVLAGWGGIGMAVLALGSRDAQSAQNAQIVTSTGQVFGAIAALWVLASRLDDDRSSGFRIAADALGPGVTGRLAGRWLGASLLGVALAALVQAGLLLLTGAPAEGGALYLCLTTIEAVPLLAAWGLLLACLGRGAAVVLMGFVLLVLGHLPWGAPELAPGLPGTLLRAWLPGPRAPEMATHLLASTALATAGVLLLGLLFGARPVREA